MTVPASASFETPQGLAAARPQRARVLAAAASLAALLVAADCAWQRALVPRLMGLEGAYHGSDDASGSPAMTARDADIASATLARRQREMGADAFRVAWTGQLEIAVPGEYTFFAHSAGPLVLRVGGIALIESASGGEGTGTVRLAAGRHELHVRYQQKGGVPSLSLDWARDRQPREPLSAEVLLPPRANERAVAAYRAGRTVLRSLLAVSVLVALGAALQVLARRAREMIRARSGLAGLACLAALLSTGALVLDDFGVSLDETMQRQVGIANYLYLAHGASRLLDPAFPERVYGPAFEVLLAAIEKEAGLADSRTIYLVRHGTTFLLFCAAVAFFFGLCLRQLRGWPAALFGCGLLVLAPRIFADAFYNSKDLPFLSLFVLGICTLVRFLDEPSPRRALWHALASALVIDVRVVGLVVPAITALLAGGDLLFARDPGRPARRRAATLALYAGATGGLTVAFFPYLWTSPVARLAEVFLRMSRFPFHRTSLYLGEQLPPEAVPWHYAPVWIGVTTPLPYLVLLGVGLLVVARSCIARPARLFGDPRRRNRLLWALWLFLPLGAVLATRATLYDGWRHLYFVYPALALVAAEGARAAGAAIRRRLPAGLARHPAGLVALGFALVFAEPASFLARNHPYGNVYFNRLAGADMRTVRDRFEVDYWGLSYRRGLEHVLRHDGRGDIGVLLRNGLGEASAAILPAGDRLRLRFVEKQRDAEYFLGNYRWRVGEYPFGHEVYAVRVGGASIMTVYDLRLDRWRQAGSPPGPPASRY
jgi:hypothetical protein